MKNVSKRALALQFLLTVILKQYDMQYSCWNLFIFCEIVINYLLKKWWKTNGLYHFYGKKTFLSL